MNKYCCMNHRKDLKDAENLKTNVDAARFHFFDPTLTYYSTCLFSVCQFRPILEEEEPIVD